jgi:hypothetical protein
VAVAGEAEDADVEGAGLGEVDREAVAVTRDADGLLFAEVDVGAGGDHRDRGQVELLVGELGVE